MTPTTHTQDLSYDERVAGEYLAKVRLGRYPYMTEDEYLLHVQNMGGDPDQVISGAATTRDPWRHRLEDDVRASVRRAARFLRDLGVDEHQLVAAAPMHGSTKRLMELMS